MANPDAAWNRPPGRGEGRWRRFSASLPMRTALLAVASVWILGCVWSYQEQSAFAASKGFTFPHLLPLVIDGFAVSMAGVAWAASLDARPAIPARLATLVAVAASSASNGVWAYLRAQHDMATVVLGMTVPVAANLAFEVLLAELRRQVQRRRGLPPPVAVPYPRMIRIALAPWQTFHTWRAVVLELTVMNHAVARSHAEDGPELGIPPAASVTAVQAEATFSHATPAAAPVTARTEAALPAFAAPGAQSPTAQTPAGSRAPAVRQPTPAATPLTANYAPANNLASARPVASAQLASAPSAAQRPAAVPAAPDRPAAVRADEVPSRGLDGDTDSGQSQDRRPIDPRVVQLAQHLASTEDADDLTGEMVGPLLNIDVAPRTGRRLLGQARELVNGGARADGLDDPELSVIGGL